MLMQDTVAQGSADVAWAQARTEAFILKALRNTKSTSVTRSPDILIVSTWSC